ncbi:MAG: rod-binding protein [Treponema sp.]|jgi:flagellar protein FlgJ|nr:rod-binding protein [Treponema sp.]
MAIEQLGSLYYASAGLEPITRRRDARIEGDAEASKGRVFAEALERAKTHEEGPPRNAKGSSKKPAVDKTDKLYEQCEALETFLIKNLLNSMRATVQKTGLIDEGFAGKMYEDMLYDVYAEDFTKQANFGLAELAYRELTGSQR